MRIAHCKDCRQYVYIERNGYCRDCAPALPVHSVNLNGQPQQPVDVDAVRAALKRHDAVDPSGTYAGTNVRSKGSVDGVTYKLNVASGGINLSLEARKEEDELLDVADKLLRPLLDGATIDALSHELTGIIIEFTDTDVDYLPLLQAAMYEEHGIRFTQRDGTKATPDRNGVEKMYIDVDPLTAVVYGPSAAAVRTAIDEAGWYHTIRSVANQ